MHEVFVTVPANSINEQAYRWGNNSVSPRGPRTIHKTERNIMSKFTNSKNIQLRLDADDHSKLAELATAIGGPKSLVIRLLLKQCDGLSVHIKKGRDV